jgi:sugar transferase (PEP-CTERM/EpsH1 system associated)
MKILYLTPRFPNPPFRGDTLHMHNIIKPMSRRHDVTLVSFIQREAEGEHVEALRPYCRRIETVHLPTSSSLLQCVRAIGSRRPFQVAYFASSAMSRLVQRVVAEEKPDVIHVHLIRMAQFVRGIRHVPRVVDLTDATSLYLSRFRDSTRNPAKKVLLSEELRRILEYEHVLNDFDLSLVCSPVDLAVMREHLPHATLRSVPNPLDMNRFPPLDGTIRPDPRRIIFTGNMTYFPNSDAARYLVKEILPLVRKEIPGVRTYLVGQNPPPSVRALAGEGVVVTGFVQDIRAEYARSSIAVAPVRFGAGTLNKIIEPLALGIPVVTTATGIGGVDLVPGEDILSSDTPEGFAAHIARLLREPALGRAMAERAGAKVRAMHDWETVAGMLEEMYRDAARGRDGRHSVEGR